MKELIRAFGVARDDPAIGVIVLTGEGPDAFCSGGDEKIRGDDGYVDEQGIGRLNVLDLQIQIRRLPKPVVAMVAGYAIGGGHVLHICCDLTIAADNARFGQTGPRVGLVRRRIWDQPAGASGRREAREGDLVLVPPVRRADRALVGVGERGRAARRAGVDDSGVVPRDARVLAARASVVEGRREHRRRRSGRRAAAGGRRHTPLLHERGGAGGARRVHRETSPTSRGSRSARELAPRVVARCAAADARARRGAGTGRGGRSR